MNVDDETILDEAARLVDGDRQASYGHPLDDFGCTAKLWSAWLEHKYGVHVPLVAEDVGYLMVLIKLSREANAPKRDNLVDGSGYFRCVEKCQDERARREAEAQIRASNAAGTGSVPGVDTV